MSKQLNMNIIGPQVQNIREHFNLTQDQVAARLNRLGWDISRGTYAKIECQRRRVSDQEALLLAEALKVGIDELFG